MKQIKKSIGRKINNIDRINDIIDRKIKSILVNFIYNKNRNNKLCLVLQYGAFFSHRL